MDDKELAQLIVEDEIDVLIDLNGMTADTRVRVFSMRPAPVQIQWLGMPGSLGGGVDVDYVIVDPWVVSNDNANGFSEALLSLPRSYQPNDHRPVDLSPSASRVSEGLPENGVVFGCFNQHYKISPDTFSCWMKILGQVPGAVLWLLQPKSDGVRARLEDLATEHGVDPGRLVFAKFAPQSAHIARLRWMDLVLDTWPYNAHTTCSDALRAGCPVLTLPGRTFASRVAEGILKTANLHDWVVSDQSDYVARAVSYGLQSREEIDRTKALVRDTYWSSSMVDNDLLAQQLEAVVLGVFERHKKGLPIQSLQLDDSLVLRPLSYGRSDLAIDETGLFAVNQKFAVDTSSATSTEEPRDIRMASAPVNLPPKTSQWLDRIKKGTPAARPDNIKLFKSDVIMYNEIPLVLDVGAADFNAPIGYEPLIKAGLAKVLGFEPDPDSFAKLEQSENTKHLKLALGDGEAHKLSVCTAPGMNSILSPRMEWLALFPMFSTWGTVNGQVPVVTSRLDDVNEAKDARFMKIDVQGAEMMILEHGQQVLNGLALLQIEASPSPLYHNEASLWKIGEWLSERGFVLHCFSELNKRRLKPYGDDHAPFLPSNQLRQVDAVFMPDPLKWDQLSDSRLFSLAFFAHVIYRSHDLAMLAMQKLDKRDSGQRVERYRLYLEAAGLDA
jgi:FkbM family methyltransferase